MYKPRQIGIPAHIRNAVTYREWTIPESLQHIAFVTWELKTDHHLAQPCEYLVLPDVCTDIIFDVKAPQNTDAVFIMASARDATLISLGTDFHYVGIRLLPGVLQESFRITQAERSLGTLLASASTAQQRRAQLEQYTANLMQQKTVKENWLMSHIIAHASKLHTVQDLEQVSGYTSRQLRRIFKAQTALSPSDFIRILKFQNSLQNNPSLYYADQSHLIKEFKRITGLTPGVFKETY